MNPAPGAWEDLLSCLRREGQGTVYVAGGVDRGKTSLCRYLVASLRGEVSTAYLDCDTGQSTLGPPGVLGCALYGERTEQFFRFVGSASPVGHLLPLLVGARRLQERAQERGAAVVVVDSPGYIEDRVAREFQIQLIDLLRPVHLVAIQRGRELEEVLAPFARHPALRIHRFPPAPGVRNRSQSERYRYREDLLQEYFAKARVISVPLDRLAVYGRVPATLREEDWRELLIAFCDAEQFVLALGVVQHLDAAVSVMRVLAPPFHMEDCVSIQVGSMKVSLSGSVA